jgi:cell division protein FtsZ
METFESKLGAKIKVVGAGGGGCNAVNTDRGQPGPGGVLRAGTGVRRCTPRAGSRSRSARRGRGLGAGARGDRREARSGARADRRRAGQRRHGVRPAGMSGAPAWRGAILPTSAKARARSPSPWSPNAYLFGGSKRASRPSGAWWGSRPVDTVITSPTSGCSRAFSGGRCRFGDLQARGRGCSGAVQGISDLIGTTAHQHRLADVKLSCRRGPGADGWARRGRKRADRRGTRTTPRRFWNISIDGATGLLINITGGRADPPESTGAHPGARRADPGRRSSSAADRRRRATG